MCKILEYFELSRSFLEAVDYGSKGEFIESTEGPERVSDLKRCFFEKYADLIASLEDSDNNKFN